MAKYKAGDKVRVVPWATEGRNPNSIDGRWTMDNKGRSQSNSFTFRMVELAGRIVTIRKFNIQYEIEELEGVYWTDDMFMLPSSLEEME